MSERITGIKRVNSVIKISMPREVVRCEGCSLNQFMTKTGYCRKCRHPLDLAAATPWPPPEPKAKQHRSFSFGVQVRRARKQRGLSQAQLAQELGWHRTYIQKVECSADEPYAFNRTILQFWLSLKTTLPVKDFLMLWLMEDPLISEIWDSVKALTASQRGIVLTAAMGLKRGQMPFTDYLEI